MPARDRGQADATGRPVKELLAIDADIQRITAQLADPKRADPSWRLRARSPLRNAQRKRLELIAATRTEREKREEAECRLSKELIARYWPR
jgi:hypothetical protein